MFGLLTAHRNGLPCLKVNADSLQMELQCCSLVGHTSKTWTVEVCGRSGSHNIRRGCPLHILEVLYSLI